MRKAYTAMFLTGSMGITMGAEPAPVPQYALPQTLDAISWLLEPDQEENSLLLSLSKAAYKMPSAARI